MNDTPVSSSVHPTQNMPPQPASIGGGYIDPLAQIPKPKQLVDLSPSQVNPAPVAQTEAVHSFEPTDVPVTPSYGSTHKEFIPPAPLRPAEIVSGHESIPEIPPQVVEAGVEHSQEITVEKNLQQQIATATQDLTTLTPTVQGTTAPAETGPIYPMTKIEAEEAIKTEAVDSGRKWNATLILKLIKEAFSTKQVDPL